MGIERKRLFDPLGEDVEVYQLSLKLRPADVAYITECHTYAGEGARFCISAMRYLVGIALQDLQGYLSIGEWSYIALALRGIDRLDYREDVANVFSAADLCRTLTEARHMGDTAVRCGVEPRSLCKKIRSTLSGLHVYAIRRRVRDYWRSADRCPLESWAAY